MSQFFDRFGCWDRDIVVSCYNPRTGLGLEGTLTPDSSSNDAESVTRKELVRNALSNRAGHIVTVWSRLQEIRRVPDLAILAWDLIAIWGPPRCLSRTGCTIRIATEKSASDRRREIHQGPAAR